MGSIKAKSIWNSGDGKNISFLSKLNELRINMKKIIDLKEEKNNEILKLNIEEEKISNKILNLINERLLSELKEEIHATEKRKNEINK